jgi:hypothetical protein
VTSSPGPSRTATLCDPRVNTTRVGVISIRFPVPTVTEACVITCSTIVSGSAGAATLGSDPPPVAASGAMKEKLLEPPGLSPASGDVPWASGTMKLLAVLSATAWGVVTPSTTRSRSIDVVAEIGPDLIGDPVREIVAGNVPIGVLKHLADAEERPAINAVERDRDQRQRRPVAPPGTALENLGMARGDVIDIDLTERKGSGGSHETGPCLASELEGLVADKRACAARPKAGRRDDRQSTARG